ncbi:type VII secretion protein EccCa [Streptomyces hainanensis]|uniref:Type VII secretion protein EccCa n=1 Tax=Streptomyces hainanensis TaxID=402648 RepID=A0A4R4T0M8_9ACTN|nr:type VII secretion protein EccCa [Streptomyces hainanensis]TDC67959.1 type VII secretion protein EccCa [Streptomyces hainanensis]
MSQIVVKRPPRSLPDRVPDEPVRLLPPPELPRGQQEGVLMQIVPMLGMGSSVVFFFMPGAAPMMRVMGLLMLVSTIGMLIAMVVRFRRGTQGQMAEPRRDYLKYLARTRQEVRGTAREQRDTQLYLHPAPEQLWALVAEGSRVWERRPGDADFGQVRLGLGEHQLATPLVAPESAPVDELEPLAARSMRRFLDTHGTVGGLPVAVSLRGFYHLTVTGEVAAARSTARSLVASLTALHSPEDVRLAVVTSAEAAGAWEWVKWLPHAQCSALDGAGTRRLTGRGVLEVEERLAADLEGRGRFAAGGKPVLDQPHVVLLLDGVRVPPHSAFAAAEGVQGVTVVEIRPGDRLQDAAPRAGLTVWSAPGELRLVSPDGSYYEGVPDALSPPAAEALARQLAPLRLGTATDEDEPLLADLDFAELLGLGDPAAVDVARTWRPRGAGERLRVPIGVDEEGQPVMLDLKEAALEGMGPHGLCVGATGSGKSELLRTLVLGLAVTHTSETLNFVLADFKGGATFTGMAGLPHVSAVITNLADDLTLVDRMGDSIRGELQRRQELLRAAGNYANLHEYEKARAAGAPLEPLASLVLVIDEFSELLTAKPDFIDMFIQIGRIGRSLGVHLLLASQRLEEGRLRGLDTYLSYRIGLRTFSAAESRTAIGTPDAYHLPRIPGSGILKFGTEEMVRFKAAYVSGPYREPSAQPAAAGPGPAQRHPVVFTADPVPLPVPVPASVRVEEPEPAGAAGAAGVPVPAPAPVDDPLADSVLDVIVRRVEGQGPAAHQVWLPPLDSAPTLDELLPDLRVSEGRGLQAAGRSGTLSVPLGLVDKPFEQRHEVLFRDFSGAGGHMLIVGGPQSGKSTVLRTLIASFALTHTPREVQFYGLDFGGGGLASMAGLPHVSGVASRLDPDRVRRTVAEVAGVLAGREEFFRRHGIDSMATYRRTRGTGQLADESWGDVFLVIDGWAAFRQDYDMTLEPLITDIAARGLGYGIHLVISAARYMELRPALKDQLTNRLELRLGDRLDSDFDRKVAAAIPADVPGRGQTPDRLHWISALPRLDGVAGSEDLAAGTAALIGRVREGWAGPEAPALRTLPDRLSAHDLPKGFEQPDRGIAIGIGEADLEPVFVDFDRDPFLFVVGENESGKTAALRLIMQKLTERHGPDDAVFAITDFRRSLMAAAPERYVGGYATTEAKLDTDVRSLVYLFEKRAPKEDITIEELRARTWWSGPRMFVIVDDHDLAAASPANPLAMLAAHLPYARDVGISVIVARNAAGVSRAMFDPLVQRMRDLGAQGLILSGDPKEGELLHGARARPLPPGRAQLVSRRRGAPLVQLGWLPEV